MGVDIYVGTLTRYFARDWRTIVQQTMPTEIHYSGKGAAPPGERAGQGNIQPLVLAWRSQSERATAGAINDDWNWDEAPELPYWTDKPGWWGHNALRAVALDPKRDRRASVKKIPQHAPGEWGGLKTDKTKEYRQIVWPQWWLPLRFDAIASVTVPGGATVIVGSVHTLVYELERLNHTTINADEQRLESYRRSEGLPQELEKWSVEDAFGFGLAVFHTLAMQARKARMPMLLDW